MLVLLALGLDQACRDVALRGTAPQLRTAVGQQARVAGGIDAWEYVHGVDEHVLTDSLTFGAGVLATYLLTDPRGAGA